MTATHAQPALTASERTPLGRRAQLLAGASVTLNVVEAIIAVAAGQLAARADLEIVASDARLRLGMGRAAPPGAGGRRPGDGCGPLGATDSG